MKRTRNYESKSGEKEQVKKLNLQVLKNKGSTRTKSTENIKTPKSRKKPTNIKTFSEDDLKILEDPPKTPREIQVSSKRLLSDFFHVPCQQLAKNLLGKVMVRMLDDGRIMKGKIVETESYLGILDKASHTYQGRKTPRNAPMFMPPGTIYVYFTYGMYHCFNISSLEEGSAVLIRALEPLEGIELMTEGRNLRSKSEPKVFKNTELCNGPSKICMALQLERKHCRYSLCSWKNMWIENCSKDETMKIVQCPRIGIDSAGPEWANKLLRFYVFENKSVSKKDKKAEISLQVKD